MGKMTSIAGSSAEHRKAAYLMKVSDVLGNKRRGASFTMYAMGLMGEGDRKSAEPIAARACADPTLLDAYHQRLTYFLSESEWSDASLRRFAARYALEEMTKRERVLAWIIGDVAFPKQGTHSVGVQRQPVGTGEKRANCQIGVGLSVATRSEHLPMDFELYLPHCWTDDPVRRTEAHIPEEVGFRTRPELAMQMIRRALAEAVPVGVVLADAAYGNSSAFRRELRERGLDYAAGVQAPTMVWRVDESGGRYGQPMSVANVGRALRARFRKVRWREGCKGETCSPFATCRVRPVDCVTGGADDEEVWLLMEMPPGGTTPCGFWLVTLPKRATREQLVRLVTEGRRTEQVHEDLKGRLGLDHFEGRTYRGWHHHVTVALVCFAFIVAERIRRTYPRQREDDRPFRGAPRAPFLPAPAEPPGIPLPPPRDLIVPASVMPRIE